MSHICHQYYLSESPNQQLSVWCFEVEISFVLLYLLYWCFQLTNAYKDDVRTAVATLKLYRGQPP